MALLRKASDATIRIQLDDEDFIEVREEVSKRDRNRLIAKMPSRPDFEQTGMTPAEGIAFQSDLFETLVTGWSLPEPPSVDAYLSLDPKGTDAIDLALAEHFQKFMPTPEEQGKA